MLDFKAVANNISNGQLPMFSEEPACAKYCPNLTFKQRIIGFAACVGIGWLLSFMGAMTLIGGPTENNIRIFVALFVVGNVIAICSSGFLLGPRSQCRQMFHPTRRYTTLFYLATLIVVFSVAVAKQNVGIVIVLLLIEIVAGTWYYISYIPFARKMAISIMRRGPCKPCFEAYDDAKGSIGGGGGKGGFTVLQEQV